MNRTLLHIARFLIFILLQGLVFGQLNLGEGIHPMIYPLFLLLLPFDIRPSFLMLLAFLLGIGVDFFMNTFGLHASASVIVAFIRPFIYRQFAPRDGYDTLKEPTISEWGYSWFFKTTIIIIGIHHFWFFLLEYFKLSALKEVFYNTFLSTIITLLIFVFIQVVFFKKPKRV